MSARRVTLASFLSVILVLPVACSSGSRVNAGMDTHAADGAGDTADDAETATDGGGTDVAPESGESPADSAGADVTADGLGSAGVSADSASEGNDEQKIEAEAGPPRDGFGGKLDDAAATVLRATAAGTRSLTLDFDVAIQGEMTGTTMAISVTHNSGTLQIDGMAYPIVVYEQIPWKNFSLTLYQAIAVLADRWAVIWFYCNTVPSSPAGAMKLTGIEYEDTLGAPLARYEATGTCSATMHLVSTQLSVPASTLAMASPVQGFALTGPTLSYEGLAPGLMTSGGRSWKVYPFNLVDCSAKCGTPGWYELHSIFWDATGSETCFGIFYLRASDRTKVDLEYPICLPQGGGGLDTWYPSSWTHS